MLPIRWTYILRSFKRHACGFTSFYYFMHMEIAFCLQFINAGNYITQRYTQIECEQIERCVWWSWTHKYIDIIYLHISELFLYVYVFPLLISLNSFNIQRQTNVDLVEFNAHGRNKANNKLKIKMKQQQQQRELQ